MKIFNRTLIENSGPDPDGKKASKIAIPTVHARKINQTAIEIFQPDPD
jgi:hypothetical protein